MSSRQSDRPPMLRVILTVVVAAISTVSVCLGADIPPQRLHAATMSENSQSLYYWKTTPAGPTAELLTLFCQSHPSGNDLDNVNNSDNGVPLVAVLRDTLGDDDPKNDRVTYVWLLTYERPTLPQRMLSAVPFFYWRVGQGSKSVDSHDTAPLLDLTAPVHPVVSGIGRDLLQWTTLDPMITPIRATSRAYRTNELDQERLHLEEAIGYLREAPISDDGPALTENQLNTILARLELRKKLMGGLVNERRAARLGEEADLEQERIRSRNWELLRQCAEKTDLLFEPIDVAGASGQYAVVWFPLKTSFESHGTSITPIWKLLNIRNPWTDDRLKEWSGRTYKREVDENGSLLPLGTPGARQLELVPLGVYSLNYPKQPLLLVDFRDKLHVREHEMTQRTINEITSGVIGISHFTNWYYYVAADLYDFVRARHGGAVDQAGRLDCYSQFRVALALDSRLDPQFRTEMQSRVESWAVNPLEAAPGREMQNAVLRYARLQTEIENDGSLIARIDKDRRAELAAFGETKKAHFAQAVLHDGSFGLYTHRAKKDPANLATLDCYRRVQYHLQVIDSLVSAGTQPEVAYDSSRIQTSILELSGLMSNVHSPEVRAHVQASLLRLRDLSQDTALQSGCSLAIAELNRKNNAVRAATASGVVASVLTAETAK
ncbi:MAG: hypothetical protein JO097_05305 [Acidobacteriaceae bacterium]|nr:hypothetical protein [Acidobacteriaceae bacterium]